MDGWFKTGDIGQVDEDGFLLVTDRKKDLLKTSGGKFVAPQPIENSLKLNALIGAAVVLGDRRRYPSVIISPHFPLLEDWARSKHISCSSREMLIANPKVRELYDDIVGQVNRGLGRHEMLKKVLLVPHEFTADDGTMTPTMKVRRKVIEERYSKQIARAVRGTDEAQCVSSSIHSSGREASCSSSAGVISVERGHLVFRSHCQPRDVRMPALRIETCG